MNSIASYPKNETLNWKYEMLRSVLCAYNEPLLNLHFMAPFLKNNCSSFNTYECIFNLFAIIPQKSRTNVIEKITNGLKEAKKKMIFYMDEDQEEIQKVLPQYHLLIQLIQNYQFLGNSKVFKTLADISHELQLMPLPYGLLPQELIYMVDHERIIPGVSLMEQIGDDFPLLNIYDQDLLKKHDLQRRDYLNFH